ncbi:Fur family transcriptional regulator, iron response regulator [Limimonas halophila]|uniref:Ferric uptake regulation protein n=1 Tax=Limimonas halophila TaxID=1082479 RepID=A0A1G7TG94_9PROT|nr:Fur family transcriptional regulator [Limimonas halophila]SDG33679.1 Fur family transcriptional regulator, iron response regulator [Limimonas halophila]
MTDQQHHQDLVERVRQAGLRPTRQRVALARLLFGHGSARHVTAEQLHSEAKAAAMPVSLATVYNALNQFTEAGLLREVVVEPGRSYFDTNTDPHHHFYFETSGQLQDIPAHEVELARTPEAPAGTHVDRVEVMIRVREDG